MPLVLAAGLVDVKPGLIFWTLITFFVVAFLLRRFAWGPILNVVDQREKAIAGSLEVARRERQEAEKLLADQKDALQKARSETAEMMRRNADDVEKLRVELVAKARAEAEAQKTEALREIASERTKAVAEVKSLAGALAVQIAEKLINKSLDPTKQRELVAEYLADVGKASGAPPRAPKQ
jgi:F-type H+-transporting ATPase subunit b